VFSVVQVGWILEISKFVRMQWSVIREIVPALVFTICWRNSCTLAPCLRRMSTIPRMVRQITIRLPIVPPTTAPRFVEEEEDDEAEENKSDGGEAEEVEAEEVVAEEVEAENEGVGPDGGEIIEEYTVELELDAGKSDVSTTAVVDREAGLSTELLGTGVELDGVVVVSATVEV
jgi:hypothetical protein